MTTVAEQFKNNPGQVLDRLVDGEVAHHERRELLALLDEEPGGWRACALAFVESQTWQSELGSMATDAAAQPKVVIQPPVDLATSPSATVAGARTARRASRGPVVGPLGLAASVLLALAVGWQLAVQLAAPRLASQNPGGNDSAQRAADPASQPDLLPDDDRAAALQSVQLSINDPQQGVSEEVDLPVTEAEELDAEWLAAQQSAMPPEMLEALEKAGHRVTQRSQVWPIRLQDGRRLLVPVEQFEVQVAKSYQ